MKRIQRKRTKGWRMPSNAKYVGRPSMFGNPYEGTWAVQQFRVLFTDAMEHPDKDDLFKKAVMSLKGSDLACWCPLDKPCHADVILEYLEEQA